MIEKIWKWYINKIYRNYKHIRGVTRLRMFLDSLYYEKFKKVKGVYPHILYTYFSYPYQGVKINVLEKNHLMPLVSERVIDGYLKKYDIEEGDIVIDAGAYPGTFSLYAHGMGAKVISIEPDEDRAREMEENFSINGVIDIEIIEKALGKDISLDELRERYGEIDFVKMDIEGWEIQALKGAEKVMEDGTDFAIASYHIPAKLKGQWEKRVVENMETRVKVEEILEENGYDVETGYKLHQTTWGVK